jgi:formylmethanofuran dehydrogenase subunit C
MTQLTLLTQPAVPLEAPCITPDSFCGKTSQEIARLPVFYGNQQARLGDWFRVEDDDTVDIIANGDLARVKHIGEGMSRGRIVVHGNAGMHLGSGMSGGEIVVHGDAHDWAGAEMTGGSIYIDGNAGHGLGGAYGGSRHGMNRGSIIVLGNAGNEIGANMRRGLIVIAGDGGDFAGAFAAAGTIIVLGHLGTAAGAGIKHGTIIAFHSCELLPTFRFDCTYQPGFLGLILRSLCARGVALPDEYLTGCYRRYSGDLNALGKGEILVYDQH